ncbi:MAG: hypothetical protein MJZ81_07885 [Bacteroidales bacterium]|nr:hypothetical protein [Bacteroidales bacterium]
MDPKQLPMPAMQGAAGTDAGQRMDNVPQVLQEKPQEQPQAEWSNMANMGLGTPPAIGGEQKVVNSLTQHKIGEEQLRKADMLLKKYRAGKASVEKRIIRSQQWWKLRNWEMIKEDTTLEGQGSTKNDSAWLWNCIVGKHAELIASYPEPIILPRMQDDKDEAKKLSDIVPVVMEMNGFEQVYNDCGWQKLIEGTGAYGVFWDKDKANGIGDISITKISILNLFWEPGVTDIQDSRNLFYVRLEDNDVLDSLYPQLQGRAKSSSMTLNKYRFDDNVDTTNKSLVVDWYYKRNQNGRDVLHYVKYCGSTVLYATEDEPETAETGLYDDGQYPFILDPLYPVEGSPCGYGLVDIGRDTQTDIDLLSNALVRNTTACSIPRYFERKDSGVNEEEFADLTRPIVHVNGNLGADSLSPITVTPIQGNAITMLQEKVNELKFITGNNDVNNGSTPSGVTSGAAIAALQEQSGRSSADSNKASYRVYRKVVTMVVERIRQFYDVMREFRIIGDRGQEQFTAYDNRGIVPQDQGVEFGVDMGYRMPVFDIEVRAQKETAYTRMAQNDLAIQLYQLGIFNPQQADMSLMLLDMMDFKGKEELVQKLSQMQTMQQMLMQYQQIALALAQKYDPMIAEQLAGNITGAAQAQGNMAVPDQPVQTQKNPEDRKTPLMRQMEQRVQNSTQPGA